jgi:hypothetical protein
MLDRRGYFDFDNPSEVELFATNVILILLKNPQRYSVCVRLENPYWLGMSSEGLAILTEEARRSKHESTFISWRFAPMVYLTAICSLQVGNKLGKSG